jgi:hypothetical protein
MTGFTTYFYHPRGVYHLAGREEVRSFSAFLRFSEVVTASF